VSDASSDTAVCKLSGVPDDAPPRSRDCFECAEPIPVERERSSFCSDRCRYRRQKRRRREHIEMTVEATDATFELHVEHARIGFVWGVACDPQVAQALREDARRPKRRRRRIPLPPADIAGIADGTL